MSSPKPDGTALAAVTERRNPRTSDIDIVPTLEVLRLLNDEDARVPAAVARLLPTLAELVDAAVERVRRGGRLHYFGAGTSGRLAMLDAAELPPTFGVEPEFATAHLAGGEIAARLAVENAEDDSGAGRLAAQGLGPDDIAIGISASGAAPYVSGAIERARESGALTALVSSNPAAPLGKLVDYHLAADTGPEAIMGSTRLKAGTATKLVLNGFSTALMVRLGRSYSNMMVDMVPTNRKLQHRLVWMLVQATGADEQASRAALSQAGDNLKIALVSMLSGSPAEAASEALEQTGGQVRPALALLGVPGLSTAPISAGKPTGK